MATLCGRDEGRCAKTFFALIITLWGRQNLVGGYNWLNIDFDNFNRKSYDVILPSPRRRLTVGGITEVTPLFLCVTAVVGCDCCVQPSPWHAETSPELWTAGPLLPRPPSQAQMRGLLSTVKTSQPGRQSVTQISGQHFSVLTRNFSIRQ